MGRGVTLFGGGPSPAGWGTEELSFKYHKKKVLFFVHLDTQVILVCDKMLLILSCHSAAVKLLLMSGVSRPLRNTVGVTCTLRTRWYLVDHFSSCVCDCVRALCVIVCARCVCVVCVCVLRVCTYETIGKKVTRKCTESSS